jgi:hypothetical protein
MALITKTAFMEIYANEIYPNFNSNKSGDMVAEILIKINTKEIKLEFSELVWSETLKEIGNRFLKCANDVDKWNNNNR